MFKNIIMVLVAGISMLAWGLLGYSIAGAEGMLIAQIAPATLDDKGIAKQWKQLSQNTYWLSLLKSAFSSAEYTGTTKSRRSIDSRDDIMGPPFVEYYDLQRLHGDRLTDTIHIPPFDGDDQVLFGEGDDAGYARVKGQNRVGYEIQAGRKNIDFCLQTYFFSIFEEDINMSEQELGGELLPLLIQHLSDLHGRYYDASRLMSIFLNYSPHVYSRIGQADATISNGDAVTGSDDLGVPAPFEHPNTFAFINEGDLADPDFKLIAANDIGAAAATGLNADNWPGKVHETVGQVDSDALPGRKMLDLTMYQLKKLRIVPIRYMTENGVMENMYIMLVSPAMMNMLYDDGDLQKRFDAAFNGHMYRHPLINEKDKIYRQLIIREIEKLDQVVYSYKYAFGGEYDSGDAEKGGHNTKGSLDEGQDVTDVTFVKSGSGRDTRVNLALGERTFRTEDNTEAEGVAQPAGDDTAIGPDGGDKIDRIIVLGASALGCVPGPVFPLERRQEDDYGNILGLGQEKMSAERRIDFPTSRDHASGKDNQGSMVIAAYNGK